MNQQVRRAPEVPENDSCQNDIVLNETKDVSRITRTQDNNLNSKLLTKPADSTNTKPPRSFVELSLRGHSYSHHLRCFPHTPGIYRPRSSNPTERNLGLLHHTKVEGGLLERGRAARIASEWGKQRTCSQHICWELWWEYVASYVASTLRPCAVPSAWK